MSKKNRRIFRFLVGGGVSAALNLLLIGLFIEVFGWDTSFLRNVANAVAIELSLVFSFFVYRIWVWPGGNWSTRAVLFRQLPLYHLSAGLALIVRIFVLFPILDRLAVEYAVNTLVGVAISASLNYVVSDRLVFKRKKDLKESNKQVDLYAPEGISPAFSSRIEKQQDNSDYIQKKNATQTKSFVLSIVIPAYNEEGCIENTIRGISRTLTSENISHEILIVNDNSRDKTEEILKRLTSSIPNVYYKNNYYPNGFGFAVRCGLECFKGDAVVISMADASDPPEQIVDYYHKFLDGYDCVFGSRFMRRGWVQDYPKHKLIVNRLANLFIQAVLGISYNDTTNAFKGYRREVIEGVSPLISHHFNLTVEIPLKAIIRGYSYSVVPIGWINRKSGVSKLKLEEMGSRYLFIVLFILIEKLLSRGDYKKNHYPLLNFPVFRPMPQHELE